MKHMMKILLLLAALPLTTFANGGYAVFGIKTDFPMSDQDAHYRDVYVNMGTDQGIKAGSQLDVFRVLTSVDELNQRTGRNLSFKFARLKVIHAESDIAVARVMKFLPPESTPLGTYTNVMVGDRVEVGTK
jgi:hypothetical protein